MNNKVILISIDGMRPDGLIKCNNPYVDELKKMASYIFDARTVFPSVTLPCHMSMFHSVPPERHGTTTNTYMPQVRPISGLFEQLKNAGKVSAMYYGWEPLRDDNGWMSDVYLDYINHAISNVKRVIEETNGEYTVIVTADHGGHDRAHGSDMDEDMTIPMFFYGPQFLPGRVLSGVSILDIAPTIADIIGVAPAKEWEGKSLISDVNE